MALKIGSQRITVGRGTTFSSTKLPKIGSVSGTKTPKFAHGKFPKSVLNSVKRSYR